MRKFLFLFIIIFLYLNLINCVILEYDEGKLDEQIIKLYPSSVIHHNNGKFTFYISKENPTNRYLIFRGYEFLKSPDGIGTALRISFEGKNSDKIIWIWAHTEAMYIGRLTLGVNPGKIVVEDFDINHIIDFSKVGPSVIKIKGTYDISATIFKNEKNKKRGLGDPKFLGTINLKPCYLFVNMEGELLRPEMSVEPAKWNLNWFKMSNNKGVWTVWINEGEFPKGYKLEDIDTSTLLFNGILEPVSIRIVGSGDNKFLMLKFSKSEAIRYIGFVGRGYRKHIEVSGGFKNGKWFVSQKEIIIVGDNKDNIYEKDIDQ